MSLGSTKHPIPNLGEWSVSVQCHSPSPVHSYILVQCTSLAMHLYLSVVPKAIFILGHPFAMYLYRFIPLPWPGLGLLRRRIISVMTNDINGTHLPVPAFFCSQLYWCAAVNRFAPPLRFQAPKFSGHGLLRLL